MADAYWKHGDVRQQPPSMAGQVVKRPRSEYDFPSGQGPDMPGLFPRRDDMAGSGVIRDTYTINSSYDRYLRSTKMQPFVSDGGRHVSSGLGGHPIFDESPVLAMGMGDPSIIGKGSPIGMGGRPEIPLPPDASSTLFVEGLPSNCTRREVSHVFRPFIGYKEVRLITKESRHPGGDLLVLCFVDFQTQLMLPPPWMLYKAINSTRLTLIHPTSSSNSLAILVRGPAVPIVGNADVIFTFQLTGITEMRIFEFEGTFWKKLYIFICRWFVSESVCM